MKSKGNRPFVWAILAIALGVAVVWFVDREVAHRHLKEQRNQVFNKANTVHAKLVSTLNSRLSLVQGLAAFVKSRKDIAGARHERVAEEFIAYTDELLKDVDGVRSVQLAPDAVVTYINPLKGNEAALGHDLLADPARREAAERAIRERHFVVAGPVELRQGGFALIGRLPIFLPLADDEKSERFWGFSIILIDLAPLLNEAGIGEQASGLKIALRGKDGLGAQGAVFFGDGAIFDADPVVQDVILPHGSWQMAALPVEGWGQPEKLLPLRAFGGAMVVAIGGLLFVLFSGREKLATNEERLRSVFEAIDEGIWDWNIVTGKVEFSPNWPKMFGYSLDEIERHVDTWKNILHPDDKAEVMKALNDHVEGRTPYYVSEHRMKKKDSAWLWILDRGKVIEWDNGGKPIRMVGAARDITERKRAEEALRASEKRLQRSVLDAPIPIMIHAEDGEVLMISQQWTELTGYTHAEIPTIDVWTEKAYGPNKDESRKTIGSLYAIDRRISEGEYIITTSTGEQLIWDFRSSPLGQLPDGRRFVISMAMDITERRWAETEARRHQFELSHVLRRATMDEMASALAHELNQPLASILNYCRGSAIRMRSKKWSAGDIAGSLEHISEEAERAVRIIRHMADFARKSELEESRVSINDIVRSICPLVEAEAHEVDTIIQVNLSDSLPEVTVQKIEIEHVVLNLVRNGIESVASLNSEKREVIIHTSMVGRNTLELAVSDTGRGVPAEIYDEVFDPFFSTKPNGMGMGLAISRSIVERHGGRLWADPPGHGGATFRFTLPITMTAKQHVA